MKSFLFAIYICTSPADSDCERVAGGTMDAPTQQACMAQAQFLASLWARSTNYTGLLGWTCKRNGEPA